MTEHDWATEPLLSQENVGKKVWFVWNGNTNHAVVLPIVKVGRTNVHVQGNGARPHSLRVNTDGYAVGNENGYTLSAWTNQSWGKRHLSGLMRKAWHSMGPIPEGKLEGALWLFRSNLRGDDERRLIEEGVLPERPVSALAEVRQWVDVMSRHTGLPGDELASLLRTVANEVGRG